MRWPKNSTSLVPNIPFSGEAVSPASRSLQNACSKFCAWVATSGEKISMSSMNPMQKSNPCRSLVARTLKVCGPLMTPIGQTFQVNEPRWVQKVTLYWADGVKGNLVECPHQVQGAHNFGLGGDAHQCIFNQGQEGGAGHSLGVKTSIIAHHAVAQGICGGFAGSAHHDGGGLPWAIRAWPYQPLL